MSWQVNGPVPRRYSASVGGEELSGASPREVLERRARMALERGERLLPGWEEEVWQALAQRHPGHIRRGKPSAPVIGVANMLSFARFVAKRLTNRSLVEPSEGRRRASICSRCPLAAPISGCSVCKDALRLTIRPPEALEIPPACSACGCWLELKAWVPREQLGEASEFPYWEQCWMRDDSPGRTDG